MVRFYVALTFAPYLLYYLIRQTESEFIQWALISDRSVKIFLECPLEFVGYGKMFVDFGRVIAPLDNKSFQRTMGDIIRDGGRYIVDTSRITMKGTLIVTFDSAAFEET